MNLRVLLGCGALLGVFASADAAAECTDPAAPNVDWRRCYFERQNLLDLKLVGANLRDASFSRSNLSGSDLSKVEGLGAKFISATMKNVKFDGAELVEADMTKADLTGASFKNADLRRAQLFRATLRGADLSGAKTRGTNFLEADLTGATWTDGKKKCAEGSIGRCH